MKFLMLGLIGAMFSVAHAGTYEDDNYPAYYAGDNFGVDRYVPATRSYVLVKLPQAGETDGEATPEALAAAIPKLQLSQLLANPTRIEGHAYIVPAGVELRLLKPAELTARRNATVPAR